MQNARKINRLMNQHDEDASLAVVINKLQLRDPFFTMIDVIVI